MPSENIESLLNADAELHEISNNIPDQLLNSFRDQIVLIKYGGNAMLNEALQEAVINDVCYLRELGIKPVMVHGGGPFIQDVLGKAGIKSAFVGGHRKTTEEAMKYVEMALKGEVNSLLVRLLNSSGVKAVGISGKDGRTVTAKKRFHSLQLKDEVKEVDLGQVGDVDEIDPALVQLLLDGGYVPVVAPVSMGRDGKDYNINADMFAGHLAGALKAKAYVAMTDVDGLLTDKDKPETLVREITVEGTRDLIGTAIQGGMIPKMESCTIAVEKGVESSRIINGTKHHSIIKELLTEERSGTLIKK